MYGFYPDSERWRVDLTFVLCILLLTPLLIPAVPGKTLNAVLFFGVFPVVAFVLLVGGMFGLPHVETRLWGGLLVTLVISFTGIIALAAARHPAGARPALGTADHAHALDRVHRILARRAADHGAVLRHLHAAAVPAGELADRRAAARADRRGAVRRRLSGGGGARRPAGDPARPVRGRDGAGPGLLAHDRSGHHAAGA